MIKHLGWLISAVLFLASTAEAASVDRTPGLVVRLADGPLRGTVEGAVSAFKGIPFAAPPIGLLRWRAPAPVSPWKTVRDARQFSPACAQAAFNWNRAVAEASQEDCLYLNVWTPRAKVARDLPVMVFFPGGANHGGSARGSTTIEPSYDGSRLAAQGVVVVTANYRLGIFGFLAHRDLTAESPMHASGNYALLDQLAALRWVKANIGRFGGDPDNVTAMGQSAGSFDLGALMTSRLAVGLMSKAILMSGPIFDQTNGFTPARVEEARGEALARALGVSDPWALDALRSLSAREILRRFEPGGDLRGMEPHPSIDGYVLKEQPAVVFAEGREVKIPLLIGATAREGDGAAMGVKGTPKAVAARRDRARTLARYHMINPASPQQLSDIQSYFKDDPALSEAALHLYGDPTRIDPVDGDVAVAFGTDVIRCNAVIQAHWHARLAPTWYYQFSHGYEPLGAVHLWDLQYLFDWLTSPADQPIDRRLSQQMRLYWVAFAKGGAPSPSGAPKWPQVSAGDSYLDFTSLGAEAKKTLRPQACALFEKHMVDAIARLRSGAG